MSGAPERYDVAVVGGGSAGIAAALSAAECGARTVLVERAADLGGNVAQALVHTVCGLYLPADAGDAVPANPGLPRRFAAVLQRAGAAGAPERAGRVWVLPTDPPRVCAVAAQLCEAAGLELRRGAEVVAAELSPEAGRSQRLQLREASGASSALTAAVVVDASGDAAVAALAGADTELAGPDELQLPSLIFRLADVDCEPLTELQGFGRLRVTRAVAGAVRSGALPSGCEALLIRPGLEPGHVYATLNVPRPRDRAYDPLDPACVDALGAAARAAAEEVVAYLRRHRPEFEKCRVDRWPARIGIRETRRVCGVERVTGDDVRTGRRRPDEVALSTWPVELWQDHRRARFEVPEGPSSIPLGALTSRSHPGLAAAGRCAAADREAHGALRVIGTALASGEAAGVAAALAADAGIALARVRAEDVRGRILERAESDGPWPAGGP